MENEETYLDLAEPVKRALIRRGDSFDIGDTDSPVSQEDILIKIVQNPSQLQEMLGLTEKQADNIRAALTGAGAGISSKFLSRAFGEEIAGAIGGFLGGHIARKIVKR